MDKKTYQRRQVELDALFVEDSEEAAQWLSQHDIPWYWFRPAQETGSRFLQIYESHRHESPTDVRLGCWLVLEDGRVSIWDDVSFQHAFEPVPIPPPYVIRD